MELRKWPRVHSQSSPHDGPLLVEREALHQATFGRPLRAGDRAVDSVVYKLRRKIGEDLGEHEVIKGVRQVGYVFTGFPATA